MATYGCLGRGMGTIWGSGSIHSGVKVGVSALNGQVVVQVQRVNLKGGKLDHPTDTVDRFTVWRVDGRGEKYREVTAADCVATGTLLAQWELPAYPTPAERRQAAAVQTAYRAQREAANEAYWEKIKEREREATAEATRGTVGALLGDDL